MKTLGDKNEQSIPKEHSEDSCRLSEDETTSNPAGESAPNPEPVSSNELSFTESEFNVLGDFGLNLASVCSPTQKEQSQKLSEDTLSEKAVTDAELQVLKDFGVDFPVSQDEIRLSKDSQLTQLCNSQSSETSNETIINVGSQVKTPNKTSQAVLENGANRKLNTLYETSILMLPSKIGICQP